MIGRIEREDFIPSIVQLQALADVLGFDITDMFEENQPPHSFIALRSESLNEVEKRESIRCGMMLALRQQILLRRKFEHVSEDQACEQDIESIRKWPETSASCLVSPMIPRLQMICTRFSISLRSSSSEIPIEAESEKPAFSAVILYSEEAGVSCIHRAQYRRLLR